MTSLELLAPARNLSVGIAAIDCGADAVYIAGPAFGARKDAGNSVEDIAALCRYAHRYGARIYVAVNTLVYEEELEQVRELVLALKDAGADALIVQDLSLLSLAADTGLPLHASTQCAIRTPERAARLQEAGFSRLILERQLSLAEIRAIREAASEVEVECFVHGALCVCYSGQCYLSEDLCGRSANRGACVQACRSLYNVSDASGRVLARDKAVLSLKDLQLIDRLEDLAAEGVCSFKIEGRLKNESYVRNVVTAYSQALNALVKAHPKRWSRASYGRTMAAPGPFAGESSPQSLSQRLRKTFNRDYTGLYLDGRKGGWAAMEAPKGMGEPVGTVRRIGRGFVEVDALVSVLPFSPGDGLSFVLPGGDIEGFRADTVQAGRPAASSDSKTTLVQLGCTVPAALQAGMPLYRNLDIAFEKALAGAKFRRLLDVVLSLEIFLNADGGEGTSDLRKWKVCAAAESEDGRKAELSLDVEAPVAANAERMRSLIQTQLSKTTDIYSCRFDERSAHSAEPLSQNERKDVPLLSAAFLNQIRRQLCEELDAQPCLSQPLYHSKRRAALSQESVSYKDNISNSVASAEIDLSGSTDAPQASSLTAFELFHQKGAELMRTRYCLRYEWGGCPKQQNQPTSGQTVKPAPGPFFLENNGRRFRLDFDCPRCEMTVKEA
ncbi:MAG: U32 family peptidase [Bacteroidales bacterium]|nr:U32 family peptidase [Bacteroidales bacterium]